jgi:hypothetical protein
VVHDEKVGKRDPEGFAETNTAKELYEAYNKARYDSMAAYPDAVAQSYNARIADAQKAFDGQRDAFALAHNLTPADAHKRLQVVSPQYQADIGALSALGAERTKAITRAKQSADTAMLRAQQATVQTETDKRASDAEAARKARMTPTERELDGYLGGIAKARGKGIGEATNWAMEHDDKAKQLYATARAERGV